MEVMFDFGEGEKELVHRSLTHGCCVVVCVPGIEIKRSCVLTGLDLPSP